MKYRGKYFWVLAGMLAFAHCEAMAEGQGVRQDMDVFFQQSHLKTPGGSQAYKFTEYRTMPSGLLLELYSVSLDTATYGFSCEARKLGYEDQSLLCEGEIPGQVGLKVGWDQIPHVFSNEAHTLYRADGGTLFLSDELQRDFQNDPGRFVSLSSGIVSYLNSAPSVPMRTRNDQAEIELRYRLAPDLSATLGASRTIKTGTRPMGTALGFSNAIEVAEPIDYAVHEASLRLDYARPGRQLSLGYALSDFSSRFPDMTWDNPRRLTDRYVSANAYSLGDGSSRGRLTLAPDNQSHSITLAGGMDLPWNSHFSAEYGGSLWLQKNPMLPYTINSAITQAVDLAGTFNDAPFDASNANNLPSGVVDSKMLVYRHAYKLSTRGHAGFRGSLEYKSYGQDNRSEIYHFPGYVRLDQVWEGEELKNERHSYRKDNFNLKIDHDTTQSLSLGAGYGYEWLKRNREAPITGEHQFTGNAVYRPDLKTLVNLSYLMAARRMRAFSHESYRGENVVGGVVVAQGVFIELPGLLRFDVADRDRHRGRAQFQRAFWEDGTASLSFQLTDDRYSKGKADLTGGNPAFLDQQYGLLSQRDITAGADFSVPVGPDWNFDAYYEFDYSRRVIRSNVTNTAPPVSQNAAEDWTARTAETSNIGGTSLTWTPSDSLQASLGYEAVYSLLRTDPIRLGTAAAVAGYRSLPVTKRMSQALKASAGYRIAKSLRLNLRYAYEKFDVSDFALENVGLQSVAADAIYTGSSLRGYYAHVAALGLNWRY